MNDSLLSIFESKIARRGGIVRRKKAYLQKVASLEELKVVVFVRRYRLFEYMDQYIVFCDECAPITPIAVSPPTDEIPTRHVVDANRDS